MLNRQTAWGVYESRLEICFRIQNFSYLCVYHCGVWNTVMFFVFYQDWLGSVCLCVCVFVVFAAQGEQKRSVTFTETQLDTSCKSPPEIREPDPPASPPCVAVTADLESPGGPQVLTVCAAASYKHLLCCLPIHLSI